MKAEKPKQGKNGRGRFCRLATAFARAEEGSLIVFALVLFVLMTMMGGLALDLMKYEQTRTALQNTLDRSTLAAASLTQDLDPEGVVRDYFAAAGMTGKLNKVTVTEGLNFRKVVADATAETNPNFVHMMGIDKLDALAAAGAEQRIGNVEIVLVLDVSGSMGDPSSSGRDKIAELRDAAVEFVTMLLETDKEGRFSIAVVPYNAQVNLGATLRGKYNATHLHGATNVNCLEIPSSQYATAGISRTLELPMAAFADTASTSSDSNAYKAHTDTGNSYGATMIKSKSFCRDTAANVVRLPSNDVTQITTQIKALTDGGNTSITLGMKWGLSLIEPGARPMFNELIDAGAIPEKFRGRPFDWQDKEAMKVIVLMTDGRHVSHQKVNDAVKTGQSPIWRATGDGNYSILHNTGSNSGKYWVPHLDSGKGKWQTTPYSNNGTTRLNWEQVWQAQRLSWVAWQLYARALGWDSNSRDDKYDDAMASFRATYASVSTMNTQLQQSCTLAKNNRVIVYGIAFEAESDGEEQISKCASSQQHYFDADGLEIRSAFRAIASNISQLRLIQ